MALVKADALKYKLPETAVSVTLDSGDDVTVPIKLVREAFIKVGLKFKDDQIDVAKAKCELLVGDSVLKPDDLQNGLADLAGVSYLRRAF